MKLKLIMMAVIGVVALPVGYGAWCYVCNLVQCNNGTTGLPLSAWGPCPGAENIDQTINCRDWEKRLRSCIGGGTGYDYRSTLHLVSTCLPGDQFCP